MTTKINCIKLRKWSYLTPWYRAILEELILLLFRWSRNIQSLNMLCLTVYHRRTCRWTLSWASSSQFACSQLSALVD